MTELKDFRKLLDEKKIPVSGMMEASQLERLNLGVQASPPDYKELYPYCKWTNAAGHVNFRIDLPASYMVGSCLDEIISSFDGIEGEDHRIVFFFDN